MFMFIQPLRRFIVPVVVAVLGEVLFPMPCLADGAMPQAAAAGAKIAKLVVDGVPQPLGASGAPLRLTPGKHQFDFEYGPADRRDTSLRMRFRLDGLETEWHEAPGNAMRFTIRFHDAAGGVVAFQDFSALGDSPGWKGGVKKSKFEIRHERVTVPEGAVRFTLMLVSGGPAFTLGVMAVDDVKVTVAGRNTPVFFSDCEAGEHLDQPGGTPRGWNRGGMNPGLLQVVRQGAAQTNHAIAVFDDSFNSFAEWTADVAISNRIAAGETLLLEWQELFSVGGGGAYPASYSGLSAGQYRFRAQALDAMTGGVRGEDSLSFVIPLPFWKSVWFVVLCAVMALVAVGLTVRRVTRRRWLRRLEELEWQQAVERERSRIARDIHDDVGTSLTRIGLLSEVIGRGVAPGSPAAAALEEVERTARAMTQTMSEIVWAVNPRYDSVEGIAGFIGRFAEKFLEAAGIQCWLDMPVNLAHREVSAEVRHNLFLALKECLHNVAKHAAASEVKVGLAMNETQLILSVSDNGRGFEADRVRRGNGLNNMAARMAALGGGCEIVSKPGEGTTIRFMLSVDQLAVRKKGKAGYDHGTKN